MPSLTILILNRPWSTVFLTFGIYAVSEVHHRFKVGGCLTAGVLTYKQDPSSISALGINLQKKLQ